MPTVQAQVLRLAQRVDPYTKAGAEFAAGTIGTTPGSRFTAQRLLDIYNEARFTLAQAITSKIPRHLRAMMVSGTIIKKTDLQFTSGVATKPTGYLEPVLLTDVSGAVITILPLTLLMAVKDLESSTNRFVFETTTTLEALTGTTNIPNASTYILRYYGLSNFALSDVTGGSTVETFNDIWQDLLVEIGSGIANEMGNTQVLAFAEKMVIQ